MFEVAEVGHRVSKEAYRERLPELRTRLLNAQYELSTAPFSVIMLLAGDDRAGANEMLNVIHDWMDARLIETNAMGPPSDEQRERPEFFRYWSALPPNGKIGIFHGAWTMRPIRDRLGKRISKVAFERSLERIKHFERALADDGAVVLKFWLHLPKQELKRNLELAESKPSKAWWVKEVDYRIYRDYEKAMRTVERALRKTSTAEAPWQIVESTDTRYRNLEIGTRLLNAVTERLERHSASASITPVQNGNGVAAIPSRSVLETIDLSCRLEKPDYDKRLKRVQARVSQLTRKAQEAGVSSVLVFEGWDAAGKGSCIRRLTRAMDAATYRVVQIAAPSGEERSHHYLWRFWRQLPRAGRVTIFDRSWYGRVLVERVEGYAEPAAWGRAYNDINEFEEQLYERGIVLVKYWLEIDAEEQLRRFRLREQTPFKKYKITDEDYRNRKRRPDYAAAANEMIARTSSEFAPWQLVPSTDKRWARIRVLEDYARALERRLKQQLKHKDKTSVTA